jgi:AraC-like DNA-binding protein
MAEPADTISRLLASGSGWWVRDIVCTAGPDDRPFEERHSDTCIALVTHGSFQYRTGPGSALLAPGALLLGNEGICFECRHEHAAGDRCLAFHYAPAHFEAIAAATPSVRRTGFSAPGLPPLPALMRLMAEAEAARDESDEAALEELSLRIAGAVMTTLAGGGARAHSPSRSDERRLTGVLRKIETRGHERLSLSAMARKAGMSPYHFLRVFRHVVGMTPHQYLLRTRLSRAAAALRRSGETISSIALEAGFEDLSTFNRRFRRLMGESPGAYRARRGFSQTR